MVTGAQRDDSPGGGDPIGPGLLRSVAANRKTPAGRRNLLLAAGVAALLLVVVLIAVAVVLFSSLSGESASYKDGDTVGGSIYASDSAQLGATAACQAAEHHPVADSGMPKGDDPAQWVKGCVAGFEAAQAGT